MRIVHTGILFQFSPVVKSIACNLLRVSRIRFYLSDGVIPEAAY